MINSRTWYASLHATIALVLLAYALPGWAVSQTEVAKLLANDRQEDDRFGWSVAVDGGTAVVGANREDENGMDAGAVYVFVQDATGTWSQQTKLTASDGAEGDGFGFSVAIDGDTVIVGAPGDDIGGDITEGSAYVFTRANGGWSEHTKLIAADGSFTARFGLSVALDGNTAIIGAPGDRLGGGLAIGSAYAFVRAGGAWVQQDKLTVNTHVESMFGWSLALKGDTAIIGAKFEGTAQGEHIGAAYVFTRANGSWRQQAKLIDVDGAPHDHFASSVALGDDIAVIGAPSNDVGGSAYVFTAVDGIWSTQSKLIADDGAPGDFFGTSVALDGDTVVISAQNAARDPDESAGSAYVFARNDGTWSQHGKLTASDSAEGDGLFGNPAPVAIDGDTVIFGAPGDDVGGARNVGSGYVFHLATVDRDRDGIADTFDNCPDLSNADQADFDGDDQGDACDADADGDAVVNRSDVCPLTEPDATVDPSTGCSLAQLCPCKAPRDAAGEWRNHGEHISCVARNAETFVALDLITDEENDYIVSSAAQSACGVNDR